MDRGHQAVPPSDEIAYLTVTAIYEDGTSVEDFRVLNATDFIEQIDVDLVEVYPPDAAVDHEYYDAFSVEWSRKWPSEEIWVAEKPR